MVQTVGFVAARLFEPSLPLPYAAVLERLRRFCTLAESSGRIDELLRVHSQLMDDGRALAAGTDPIPRRNVLRAFATGALRTTRLSSTVEGGPPRPPSSLDRFRPDARPEDEVAFRAALSPLLNDEDWAEVDARLERGDRALRTRRAVVKALHRRFPSDHPEDVHRAFGALFVGHPLAPGEVGWLRTASSTFFLVPHAEGQLTDPSASTEGRERELGRFLGHLTRFEQRYFAHFPVFGGFRGEYADATLLEALADETQLSVSEVAHHLTTSVSVIPRDQADQYLVHDAWGHVWQALLFRFDESYRAAAGFEALPPLDEHHGGTSLAELAAGHAEGRSPDPTSYLKACLHHRLHLSLSGLMAEVLADAVEAKVTGDRLPSSSKLPHTSTRLDLTLSDLPYYFQVATRGLQYALEAPEILRQALTPSLAPAEATRAAEALLAASRPWLEEVFAPRFLAQTTADGVRVNVFDRVALNFLGFQAELNARFFEAAERGRADALLFAVASFLEEDWAERFWHLDELVGHLDELLAVLPARP